MEAMDDLVKSLRKSRDEYEAAKKVSNDLHATYEQIKLKVINALEQNNRKKYEVDGEGLVYITYKDVWSVPKENDKKLELFDYIKTKHGEDTLNGMLSINYMTLNSWANSEVADTPGASIPGLALPTTEKQLSLRKK